MVDDETVQKLIILYSFHAKQYAITAKSMGKLKRVMKGDDDIARVDSFALSIFKK